MALRRAGTAVNWVNNPVVTGRADAGLTERRLQRLILSSL
jgi:hypothetical protein